MHVFNLIKFVIWKFKLKKDFLAGGVSSKNTNIFLVLLQVEN
jgi:hypothetical protein